MTSFNVNMAEHTCGPDCPIRNVLKRIDQSPHLFQIIIDADGKLLGTATDGDIRRAMLHDIPLDAPISVCMQIDPVTGRAGDNSENVRKLKNLGSSRSFLPIIDQSGKLIEIDVLQKARDGQIATALVMAGGLGRRLGSRTKNTPKPLLPVGGKPILEHVLRQLEDANIEDILISVHYLAEQIHDYVGKRENRARIELVTEDEPRGTVGVLGDLPPITDAPILIVNGDVITHVDYGKLYDFHVRHGHDGTIGVARHDIEIPYGVVKTGEDGLFSGIDEKPRISNFIAAGIYFLAPEFIGLVPQNRVMDMPELLNLGQSMGLRMGVFPLHEYWIDVGQPNDLAAADSEISDPQTSST